MDVTDAHMSLGWYDDETGEWNNAEPRLPRFMTEEKDEVPEPCSAELRRGSLVDPPEFCEEEADPISGLCYWHDPDGAAADRAEQLARERREEASLWRGE